MNEYPEFGIASICERRIDTEDDVAVHPSFLRQHDQTTKGSHHFKVHDGHDCSHVVMNFFKLINGSFFHSYFHSFMYKVYIEGNHHSKNGKE